MNVQVVMDSIFTMDKLEAQRDSLLAVLRKFVDQYDTDRRTWPDDMHVLLDEAHGVIAKVTGEPRQDY
jgi:hypothetical protein